MSAYWGSRWIAVTGKQASDARVEMIDLRPGATQQDDQPLAMVPEHLSGYPSFKSQEDAISAVRADVLEKTRDTIIELVVAVEINKLEIERCRAVEPNTARRQERIERCKRDIEEMTQQLKGIRELRRRKIPVT